MSHAQRIKNLQNKIIPLDCDGILVEDPIALSYLTGLQLSAGTLLFTREEVNLMVDPRYFEMARRKLDIPVHYTSDKMLNRLVYQLKVDNLAFAQEVTSYERYAYLKSIFPKRVRLKPITDPVMQLRMIKDPVEIQYLRDAAELCSKGYDFVLSILRAGITESEVAKQLELYWCAEGGKGPGFEPIIAFGVNSSMPHHRSGETKLEKRDIVLIDIGVILNDYHSDMTRCVFYGKPMAKLRNIYGIVQEAQEKALSVCRPGISAGELDEVARSYIKEAGFGGQFTHGLGHGVGREIHEAPRLSNKPPHDKVRLKMGMAVTIEPGIYLPGVGGVRIEDTVIIQKSGHENLSRPSKEMLIIGA